MTNPISQKIHEIELLVYGPDYQPGISLYRASIPNTMFKWYGIKVPKNQRGYKYTLLWFITIYNGPYTWTYHGITLEECVENAWKKCIKKADKSRSKFVMDHLAKERAERSK